MLAGLLPVLTACRSFDANDPDPVPEGLKGLHFNSSIRLEQASLYVGLTVTNISEETLRLEYGACAVRLRIYEGIGTSGTPSWRSEDWQDVQTGQPHTCEDYQVILALQPGYALMAPEFQVRVPVQDILRDALPEGRYTVTAVLELNGLQTGEINTGDVLLAAQP